MERYRYKQKAKKEIKRKEILPVKLLLCIMTSSLLFCMVYILKKFLGTADKKYVTSIVNFVMMCTFVFLLAAAVIFLIVRKKISDKDIFNPYFTKYNLLYILISFALSSAVIYFEGLYAASLVLLIVPMVFIISMIFFIYQNEFWMLSCVIAFGIFIFNLVRKTVEYRMTLFVLLLLLAVALFMLVLAILTVMCNFRNGSLSIKHKENMIFPKNAKYSPFYILYGIIAVISILTIIFGYLPVYFGTFILFAYFIVFLFVYTIRLIKE